MLSVGVLFERIAKKKAQKHCRYILYISHGQLAARGLIYSGPHQVTGLVRLVKISISA
jgi:hypothetical protein